MANNQLLTKVRDAIIEYKERFHYAKVISLYAVENGALDLTNGKHDCGTLGCVAGFTLAVVNSAELVGSSYAGMNLAADILELVGEEKEFLFLPMSDDEYDDPYLAAYEPLPTFRSYIADIGHWEEAVNRINYLIRRDISNAQTNAAAD